MKIFIAGCARSGTSLTRGLIGCCFQEVFAPGGFSEAGEASAAKFDQISRSEPHLILKRTATCYQTLPDLRTDVDLLYCVRHPFDTLTSSHIQTKHLRRFHVTPERWLAEFSQWRQFRARQPRRNVFVLRYEDLIGEPDRTQLMLAEHFGLVPVHPFSQNPARVVMHSQSVEKWRHNVDLLAHVSSLDNTLVVAIRAFCNEFGYCAENAFCGAIARRAFVSRLRPSGSN